MGGMLASGSEGEAIDLAGRALVDAMEKIVDSSSFYRGVSGRERLACISRLAFQALLAGLLQRGQAGTNDALYATVSGAGRLLGQLLVQAPTEAEEDLFLAYLKQEMRTGAKDFEHVTAPKGNA